VSVRLHPEKWSNNEIPGHLLDSASNNHQRFVAPRLKVHLNQILGESFTTLDQPAISRLAAQA
jgi:hypothetical protein